MKEILGDCRMELLACLQAWRSQTLKTFQSMFPGICPWPLKSSPSNPNLRYLAQRLVPVPFEQLELGGDDPMVSVD